MPLGTHKSLLSCTESAAVRCVDHPNTRPFLLTELRSCSNASHQRRNSMKTALCHQKLAFSLFFLKKKQQQLSSVARISWRSSWFFKVFWKSLSQFQHMWRTGRWMLHTKLCRFLMSSASDWAARFRPRPPFLQTAPVSGPPELFFVILNEWCVSA